MLKVDGKFENSATVVQAQAESHWHRIDSKLLLFSYTIEYQILQKDDQLSKVEFLGCKFH